MLQQAERLILQPFSGAALVRRWLLGNGWSLTDEDLMIDDDRFYEIIVADRLKTKRRGQQKEDDSDRGDLLLEIGPKLLEKKHSLLADYLDKQIRDMENVLIALKRAQTPEARQRKEEWANKIAFYQTVINELKTTQESE